MTFKKLKTSTYSDVISAILTINQSLQHAFYECLWSHQLKKSIKHFLTGVGSMTKNGIMTSNSSGSDCQYHDYLSKQGLGLLEIFEANNTVMVSEMR